MKTKYVFIIVIIIGLIAFLYLNSKYIIRDDEHVVITQFGNVVGKAHSVPGEYFKIPFIQKVHYFKKYANQFVSSQEIPTKDKKWLLVEAIVQWEIDDPAIYYTKLNSYELANKFVIKQVGNAERNLITSYKLTDIINRQGFDQFSKVKCNSVLENKIEDFVRKKMNGSGIKLLFIEETMSLINK